MTWKLAGYMGIVYGDFEWVLLLRRRGRSCDIFNTSREGSRRYS